MRFKIIGTLSNIEVIATGKKIKELKRLNKVYGEGRWRKLKGNATIEVENGSKYLVELHWYEAHAVGKKEYKIKKFLN
jgi:hypothetical protein